jgi:hypothetical protein
MQLRALCGRPLLDSSWGWVAGWIYDVLLDPAANEVAAFEVCEPDRMQFVCVAPFTVHTSARWGMGIDIDRAGWNRVEREPHWMSVRGIQDVTVMSGDGEWSCRVTDVDCDPDTWRLVGFRLRRPRWKIFGKRLLPADQVVSSDAEVIVVDKEF